MKDALRGALAIALLALFALSLGALYLVPAPEANRDLLNFMLGQLSILTAGALTFYFGTSKSSADKNDLLAARDGPLELTVSPKEE